MDSIKYKIKFISSILLSAFITLIFSLATGIAAQLINLNAEVAINYEAPLTLISGPNFNSILRNNYNSATSIVFDYGTSTETDYSSITKLTPVVVDSKSLGYEQEGISMFYTNKQLYVLSQKEILAHDDCSNMFSASAYVESNLETIIFNNFNTKYVKNMAGMFEMGYREIYHGDGYTRYSPRLDYSLTSLDVSGFNTSQVINMNYMFQNCAELTSLDLSNFDTSNVTEMMYMFSGCLNLASINLNGWDTSNVTKMTGMFNLGFTYWYSASDASTTQYNYSLIELDLSSFDTSKVTSMYIMFAECRYLTTIYVSKLWSTESVTSGNGMFADCKRLKGTYLGMVTYWDSNYIGVSRATYTSYLTLKE